MKKLMFMLMMNIMPVFAWAGEDVLGYWKTIDDETNEAKSIVRVYEYKGKVYGRVVKVLTDPTAKAKLPGDPLIEGLDIIWDLKAEGEEYTDGEILDPKKGKVYGCEMWREGDNLIVRGKIAFLGRNQIWLPETTMTDKTPLVPKKPKLK